eukprot:g631.t1
MWNTESPFLFAVYHDDLFPKGNEKLGPARELLRGRNIGSDFSGEDGWSMYHGSDGVPGFPRHPHRGFETVSVVRHGRIDHSDSLGCTARFGGGDVQWMTAGSGIVHSEMFPLLDREQKNRMEMFQIWLNLPKKDKMADPHFKMLWGEEIPAAVLNNVTVKIVAGPNPFNGIAIYTVLMAPGTTFTLPASKFRRAKRNVYFFKGKFSQIIVGGRQGLRKKFSVEVNSTSDIVIENQSKEESCEFMMLQGIPIDEPVVQHGPFVGTTQRDIHAAFQAYQMTQFGGWSWPVAGPTHPREEDRFTLCNGKKTYPPTARVK